MDDWPDGEVSEADVHAAAPGHSASRREWGETGFEDVIDAWSEAPATEAPAPASAWSEVEGDGGSDKGVGGAVGEAVGEAGSELGAAAQLQEWADGSAGGDRIGSGWTDGGGGEAGGGGAGGGGGDDSGRGDQWGGGAWPGVDDHGAAAEAVSDADRERALSDAQRRAIEEANKRGWGEAAAEAVEVEAALEWPGGPMPGASERGRRVGAAEQQVGVVAAEEWGAGVDEESDAWGDGAKGSTEANAGAAVSGQLGGDAVEGDQSSGGWADGWGGQSGQDGEDVTAAEVEMNVVIGGGGGEAHAAAPSTAAAEGSSKPDRFDKADDEVTIPDDIKMDASAGSGGIDSVPAVKIALYFVFCVIQSCIAVPLVIYANSANDDDDDVTVSSVAIIMGSSVPVTSLLLFLACPPIAVSAIHRLQRISLGKGHQIGHVLPELIALLLGIIWASMGLTVLYLSPYDVMLFMALCWAVLRSQYVFNPSEEHRSWGSTRAAASEALCCLLLWVSLDFRFIYVLFPGLQEFGHAYYWWAVCATLLTLLALVYLNPKRTNMARLSILPSEHRTQIEANGGGAKEASIVGKICCSTPCALGSSLYCTPPASTSSADAPFMAWTPPIEEWWAHASSFRIFSPVCVWDILIGLIMLALFSVVALPIGYLTGFIGWNGTTFTDVLSQFPLGIAGFVDLFIGVTFPEELFFRGILLHRLEEIFTTRLLEPYIVINSRRSDPVGEDALEWNEGEEEEQGESTNAQDRSDVVFASLSSVKIKCIRFIAFVVALTISSIAFGLMHWNEADSTADRALYCFMAACAGMFYGTAYRLAGNNLLSSCITHALTDLVWEALLK